MDKRQVGVFFSFLAAFSIGFYFIGNKPSEGSFSFSSIGSPAVVVSSDPGPNMPPVGRSLFDFLTMKESGGGTLIQEVPFPIEHLESLMKNQLTITSTEGVHGVLLPLGRSLQRMASAPDFFRYPRVVMGVAGNPKVRQSTEIAMLLRNRLYIGYNEKANALEILSYNEMAGRFEFQIVHDYGPNMKPSVQYANRSVCLSCHQNQAPIFSDAQWSETNANPEISKRIMKAMFGSQGFDGKTYGGFPIELSKQKDLAGNTVRDITEPSAIDRTKFVANLIPVNQFLWQKLCDEVDKTPEGSASCRAQTFALAMKMALMGKASDNHPVLLNSQNKKFIQSLMQSWNHRWPDGLAIPAPSIPDRDPLDETPKGDPFNSSSLSPEVREAMSKLKVLQTTNVISKEQEPLSVRKPMEIWHAKADANSHLGATGKWIASLGTMLADSDWTQIDQWMLEATKNQKIEQITAECQLDNAGKKNHLRISNCSGSMNLLGSIDWTGDGKITGVLSYLALDWNAAQNLPPACQLPNSDMFQFAGDCVGSVPFNLGGQIALTGNKIYSYNLQPLSTDHPSVRMSDGNRIAGLSFDYSGTQKVTVTLKVVRDFQTVQNALNKGGEVFARKPFSRVKVMQLIRKELTGVLSNPKDCCEDTSRMPAAQAEADTMAGADPVQIQTVFGSSAPFIVNCAICHRNSGGFPSNYLYGSTDEVKNQLSQCAERIWFRLNDKTAPMPPLNRLKVLGMSSEHWLSSPALAELKKQTEAMLKAKGVSISDLKSRDYNSLPECKGQ